MSILQSIKEFIYRLKALKNPKRGNFNYNSTVLDVSIGFNKYGTYCLPNKSYLRPAVQKVIQNKAYEPQTIELMSSIIKENEGDVIHAGTFFGDFLPALSNAAIQEDQKIWAFEPNTESYRCAQITLLLNNIKNVKLTNAGLGEEENQKYLKIKDTKGKHVGGASTIVEVEKKGHTESIEIVSIDNTIPLTRKVSIIQLDVEGYELQALKGALKTIQTHLPILILEDNLNAIESAWFKTNILGLGYEHHTNIHGNKVFKVKNTEN